MTSRGRLICAGLILLALGSALPIPVQAQGGQDLWEPIVLPGELIGAPREGGVQLRSLEYRFVEMEPLQEIRRVRIQRGLYLDVHDALWQGIDRGLDDALGDTCKYKLVIHSRPRGAVQDGRLHLRFEFTCHARHECKADPKVRLTLAVSRKGNQVFFSDAGHRVRDTKCNDVKGDLWSFVEAIHDSFAGLLNGHSLDRILFPQLYRPFPTASFEVGPEYLVGSVIGQNGNTLEKCGSLRNRLDFQPAGARFAAKGWGNPLAVLDAAETSVVNARCFERSLASLVSSLKTQQERIPKDGLDHLVRDGEHWWAIAEHYYGDGRFHNLLRSLNDDRWRPDGELLPGETLRIEPLRRLLWDPDRHVVGLGQTLWSIAGDRGVDRRPLIEQGRESSGDPDLIYPLSMFSTPREAKE